MKKFLNAALPVFILIIFVVVMQSGSFLKRPIGDEEDISRSIFALMEEVQNENWDGAQKRAEKLNETWAKIVKRIQFSSERDEIHSFYAALARLNGAIMAEDKSAALRELNEAYNHYNRLAQ